MYVAEIGYCEHGRAIPGGWLEIDFADHGLDIENSFPTVADAWKAVEEICDAYDYVYAKTSHAGRVKRIADVDYIRIRKVEG